jgi:DNA-binding XRE family transcriptional regulator
MNTKASIKDIRSAKVSGDIHKIASELYELASLIDQTEQKEMIPLDGLGQTLKDRRKELGLANQEEAAALSSVSIVTYRKAETSDGNPTLKTLKAIAEGLNLKLWIEKC